MVTFVYLLISGLMFTALVLIVITYKDSDWNLSDYSNLNSESQYEQYFLKLQRYLSKNDHKSIDKTFIYGLIKTH